MELESAQSNTTAKLPILKLGLKNGKLMGILYHKYSTSGMVTYVTKMSVPVTAEEKTNKKNDVKARSLLLMALSNEHQLTFSQYSDAKTMFAAIETRFGGNEATKKTQKTLLAILGVVITQEGLNSKFLRSLPPEWNTHVVVWMNKADIETMSIDVFTNDVNTANPAYEVSIVSPNINTACSQVSTANFSDNTVYAFMVENPNGSNLLQWDLEQIHEDDLEAIDLKWQLSLLSVRAKRYFQRTRKKICINANDTAGYDKSKGKPQQDDTGFIDSGCSRHMTGNIAYLSDFKEFDGGYVTFGGGAHGGRISGKGTLKTDSLDFKDVYFVNELNFNLFSVSQMCDKKNYVLFTDTECLVLSPNFKLPDESQILLKIPRKDNMYSFDMKNIVPKESLTCLVAKATSDESMLWHRRLGHINFKNINKLVKDNLVRGLPTKHFENDQTCVACLKGKQHRASCKSKVLNPITELLFMLYMDLFGPTFVSNLMHKKYCLVVTDDYSRFTWVFFLTTKDETSEILKNFIKEIENLVDKKVKIIRSDIETKFKNKVMDDFYREKGIKREYSVARTPQQNGVAERRNMTLIEAARTMLADSKLPTTFWLKAVLVYLRILQNRGLVVKPYNKTPYELFRGKFDSKSDEGFFVGCSLGSKAFRVYNTRTRRVEENLHFRFLENKPMIEGNGPKWLFDIDSLTESMNYVPVAAGTISNESAGTQGELNACTSTQKEEITQDCIMMPIWKYASYFDSHSKDVGNGKPKSAADDQKHVEDGLHNESDEKDKSEDDSSPKKVNVVGQHVNTASPEVNIGRFKLLHTLEATHVEFFSDEDEPEVDLGNIINSYTVPTTPNTRIHKDHPIKNVIGDVKSSIQTRRITKSTSEQGFLSAVEPIQEELLQFKLQQVWKLVDLPNRKRAIGTKWIFKNKKDERGIMIRNKSRLVAQGHRQEEVYQMYMKSAFLYGTIEEEFYVTQPPGFKDPDHLDKVYKVVKVLYGLHQAPRAWYKTLANYLLGNGFKRGKIDHPLFIKKQKGDILLVQVYVDDIIFGSTNKELCTAFEKLMKDKFQMSSIGELTFFLGLQVTQKEDGIFISQDKYVAEIMKKFNYTDVKSASTLVDLEKPLVKDGDADDVDVHLYRSMIGSLMYLTASRPDIMFAEATNWRLSVFWGNGRISWQCKKQTMIATSTTKVEYVAAASCCGQVLWIQNQLLDYGYNFMNTMIHIDNNSTICIIENPVQHSKTKHIEIRHHFIRDCNAKKLIQMVKIDTEHNVADLLTKGFDAGRQHHLGQVLTKELAQKVVQGATLPMGGSPVSDKVTALEDELRSTKAVYNKSIITLTKRVKKLENMLKLKRRSTIVNSSEDEEVSLDIEDPSNQRRMIEEIDQDENVSLVKSSKHGEAHETVGHKMESGVDFSNASPQNDDDELTLAETLREMIQIGHDEELAQKLHAEELAKSTARKEQEKYDFEKALELQKQLDEREEVISKSSQVHDIDWSDPAGGYKLSHFKGMKYEDIRPIFERVWDQNHAFVSKDYEIEKEVMKRSDGSYKTYIFFSQMLNDFDREDLIVLHSLFNEKYAFTKPGFDDLMLWGDMKVMLEPDSDDAASLAQLQGRPGGNGDQGSLLPRSMCLDVPKFIREDLEKWNGINTDWERLKESVMDRFGPSKFEDLKGALSKLLQLDTVEEYQGDAFSLARVTEARLDDQAASVSVTETKVVASSGGQCQMNPYIGVSSNHETVAKSTLLPAPIQTTSNTNPKPHLAIKWILLAERQEQLNKGLCYNCDNQWVRGHKCPGKFLLLMTDDEDNTVQDSKEDVVKSGDLSTLNSLIGQGGPRSLKL
ncbi:retrovirus-related pol polyprotein from transposon TNT 1-94 [Tanacetum coccineum]